MKHEVLLTEKDFLNTLQDARRIQEIIDGYGGIHAMEAKIAKIKSVIDAFGSVDELMESVRYLKERVFVFKDLFTVEDAANYAGVSPKTIQRRIDEGCIKARQDKGIIVIERKEVLRWLRSIPVKESGKDESCHN